MFTVLKLWKFSLFGNRHFLNIALKYLIVFLKVLQNLMNIFNIENRLEVLIITVILKVYFKIGFQTKSHSCEVTLHCGSYNVVPGSLTHVLTCPNNSSQLSFLTTNFTTKQFMAMFVAALVVIQIKDSIRELLTGFTGNKGSNYLWNVW